MKPGLLFLPFLSILVAAIAAITASSLPDQPVVGYLGWALAASLVALWVVLDLNNFKEFFSRKGAKYGASSALVVVPTVLIIIGIGFLSNKPRFNKSFDATRSGSNTLSEHSVKTIQNLHDRGVKVQIQAFFVNPQSEQEFRDLLGLYEHQGAEFTKSFHDPQQDRTLALAEKITSADTVIFRQGNQEARITTFSEEKVTNAMIKVLKEGTKRIYFTVGHGEGKIDSSDPTGYQYIVQELENVKYEAKPLNILEQASVPEDADLVVIAGPQYDFKKEEIRFLDDYLRQGGALLTMVDAFTPTAVLNDLLEKYGIRYQNDLLILNPEDPARIFVGGDATFVSEFDEFNPVTKDFARTTDIQLILYRARSLAKVDENTNQMKVETPAQTGDSVLRVKDVRSEKDLEGLSEERLDQEGPFAVIAVATGRPKAPATADNGDSSSDTKADAVAESGQTSSSGESRVVAIGSAQFANNGGLQRVENKDLFLNATSYLLQDEDFISIRPKDQEKSTLELGSPSSQLSLAVITWLYPFFFLGGGIFYWMRRRKA